jgi:hypothetical protein
VLAQRLRMQQLRAREQQLRAREQQKRLPLGLQPAWLRPQAR